jgi:hypothetical protein
LSVRFATSGLIVTSHFSAYSFSVIGAGASTSGSLASSSFRACMAASASSRAAA